MIDDIKKGIYKLPKEDIEGYISNFVSTCNVLNLLDNYKLMFPDYDNLLAKNDSYSSEIQELKVYKEIWSDLYKKFDCESAYMKSGQECTKIMRQLEVENIIGE